jgi:CRISPR-associated protein Csm1
MAQETADLEDASKKMDGKDSITLFSENHSFKWDDFIYSVYDKKFKLIYDFFEENAKIRKNNDENVESRGKNYLYNILELVRNCERSEEGDDEEEKKSNKMKYGGKLNIARLAYMLSRLAPEKNAPAEYKELYDEFSRKLYEWSSNSNDRREIIMAIYIYAYLQRKQGK